MSEAPAIIGNCINCMALSSLSATLAQYSISFL